jgi:hypothetical protein
MNLSLPNPSILTQMAEPGVADLRPGRTRPLTG